MRSLPEGRSLIHRPAEATEHFPSIVLPRAFLSRAVTRRTSRRTGRLLTASGLAGLMLWVSALPVAAHRPPDGGVTASTAPQRDRQHSAQDEPADISAWILTPDSGSIGYDISYPQCNGPFPTEAAFKIVGVNRGKAYTTNPCLGTGDGPSELRWAGRRAWLYANTGNPGPHGSDHWPVGQQWPQRCTRERPFSVSCAYDYGWNAARQSYLTAVRAYISLGWASSDARRTPGANRWWLDVETSNSWMASQRMNIATLQGAVDFLESRDVGSVGFYSAKSMWAEITGDTQAFGAYTSWIAGASTLRGAKRKCDGPGFTGGGVELSQFPRHGFDANVAC